MGTFYEPPNVHCPQGNLQPHLLFYDSADIPVLEIQADTRAEVELQIRKEYMELFTCTINND